MLYRCSIFSDLPQAGGTSFFDDLVIHILNYIDANYDLILAVRIYNLNDATQSLNSLCVCF